MIFFGGLALLLAALGWGASLAWDEGGARLRQLRQRLQLVEQAGRRAPRPSLALLRDDLLSEIPALNQWLRRLGPGTRLQRWLGQAACRMRPGTFVLLCAACGLGSGAAAAIFTPWYGLVLGAGAGALLPGAWVGRRRKRRLAVFQTQFPEAIDLLVRASRAGHPPSAALEIIAVEMPEPVAGEFRQVFDQQRFGLPLRDVLLNLAERVPLVDVRFFAIAIILQRESGGNLAEILDKLATMIRERGKILRQVKTHTAQGRMTMAVLLALAPLLLVAMLGLSRAFVLPLFVDPLGRELLSLGLGLQVVGLFLLNKIIDIRV